MGFRSRKTKGEQEVTGLGQTMPGQAKTLGHQGAIDFSQAVIDQRWGDAEQLFSASELVDQAHMISVASDIGGTPDMIDAWVDHQDGESGLGELLRGALSIVHAWDVRSTAESAKVGAEAIDQFHRVLGSAEADLFSAAEKMPESSIPWQHLLTSGRGLHTGRSEMDDRYVNHIERGELLAGHMSFQQLISQKWAGSHNEMWEHAEFMSRTSEPGSTKHALVAIALIEHHIKPDVRCESIRQLPDLIGKTQILGDAAHNSYADANFNADSPEGAMALSAWFTLHYLMGNWDLAASLTPMIGDRFTRFPMVYFQEATWPQIQTYVQNRLAQAA